MRTVLIGIGRPLRVLVTAVVVVAVVMASSAWAQVPAGNFQELGLKVKAGDSIYITDQTGREFRAEILELVPPTLVVSIEGNRRIFTERDVKSIRQRLADPLWSGATIGAGVGVGLGVLATSFSEDCSYDPSGCVGGVFMLAGISAGIGVGIDALIQGRKIIYSPPGGVDVSMAAFMSPQFTGAMVRIRY